MNALILANFPIAALIFLAIVGIPLWMTFKRPETAPDYTEARAYQATASATPSYAAATSAGPSRLRTARQHAAAQTVVPGRRHAVAQRSVREHTVVGEQASAHAAR